MESVAESTQKMQAAFLPPSAGNVTSLHGLDLSGAYRQLSLLDVGGLCKPQGGYYYEGGDGYLYWHDCAGATV